MSRRTPRNTLPRLGQPPRLTPERADRIIEAVQKGNHITTACAAGGVGRSTLYTWLQRANNDEQRIANAAADGQPLPTDIDPRYLDFRDRLQVARAQAEMRAVATIEKGMAGGFVISEEPVVNAEGDVQYDEHGKVLWKRTYSQPDGRLALSYLGRSRPGEWGQNATRVEVAIDAGDPTGGGEGAGQRPRSQYEALAQRIAEIAADRRREDEGEYGQEFAEAAEDDDTVYDAEIVEDEDGG